MASDVTAKAAGPLWKPEKVEKQPKGLQRKTPLRSYKVDKNGIPILSQPKATKAQKQYRAPITGALVFPKVKIMPQPPKDPADTRKIQKWYRHDPLWELARKFWFEQNPPDLDGDYYQCRLCPFAVHKDETTLDHIEPRSTSPELKYVLSNLQPAHGVCNQRKGSMSMENYERQYGLGGRLISQI